MQSRPVLVLLGLLILFFAWSVLELWGKMAETANNRRMAEEKVVALNEQKAKLSSEIESLETDQGKEKFFRENLGLAKEGEGLIVVVEDKNTPKSEPAPDNDFFSFFRNLFK